MSQKMILSWTTSLSETIPTLANYDRPADRIRQHRQVSAKPVLLVEGPSDRLVLERHVEGADIFPVSSKISVISCLQELENWGLAGIVGVTDRDFDKTPASTLTFRTVLHLYYDMRDLESMLVDLGVLANVLRHLGSENKISRFGGVEKLVEKCQELGLRVARLRKANNESNLGIHFDEVPLAKKIDTRTLGLKASSLCAALAGTTAAVSGSDLHCYLRDSSLDDGYGPRGKDVVAASGVALRSIAGSQPHSAVEEALLTGVLHSSCGLELANSAWIRSLRDALFAGQTVVSV